MRAGLLVGTALAVALALRFARRSGAVVLASLLVLVLVAADLAAAANARYDHFPTLGAALGAASRAEADTPLPPQGQVLPVTIPGTTSGFVARPAQVYLPPAWFARTRPQLPVIVLMHGTPGSPTDWVDDGAVQATADAWAAAHHGVSPVIVMPDINGSEEADTECVDSPRGNVETYLTVDVPALLEREFSTRPPGRGWALGGLSEGGTCAAMLALRHPDRYVAFADIAGLAGPRTGESNADTAGALTELFGGDEQEFDAHEPAVLLGSRRYPGTGGWFQVGGADAEPVAAAQQLVPLAGRAGIGPCLIVMPGAGHTPDVWAAAFRDSLPWLAARLGLVPATPEMTSGCGPLPRP